LTQSCDVDVWLITLESDGETVLSPDEELRAARFRFERDRLRWIRAHSALRLILASFAEIPPAQIRFVVGPHGKPALADGNGVEFSLSHSGSWAMVAVTHGVPVGVDIERIREEVNMTVLLKRLGETDLPDTETGLYQVWTRREATSKAAGGALFDAPNSDFRVCHLEAPEGYSASLALIGRDPSVRLHSAPVPPTSTE
jgi:4'-phosphopantetheinyl transferase